MDNYYDKKYTRAKQEEGRGTYEGLRRSQRKMPLRALLYVVVVLVIGWLGIAIQGHIEGNHVHTQFSNDVSYMAGKVGMGRFYDCDMNHNCTGSNKSQAQQKYQMAKQQAQNDKNNAKNKMKNKLKKNKNKKSKQNQNNRNNNRK